MEEESTLLVVKSTNEKRSDNKEDITSLEIISTQEIEKYENLFSDNEFIHEEESIKIKESLFSSYNTFEITKEEISNT